MSTCGWCKKTKRLLKDLNVRYQFVDVDLLAEDDRDKIQPDLDRFNPNSIYPTVVKDRKIAINGYREDEIRKAVQQ